MGIETICLQEAAHLIKRDLIRSGVVSCMYLAGIINPTQAKICRSAYFFFRHIDDVLDGDRKISTDPKDYVHSILEEINGNNHGPKIIELYNYFMERIEDYKRDGDNPEEDSRKIIEIMLFDYQRSKEKTVYSRRELEEYFKRVYVPVMNISLMIARSQLRGKNIPEMVSIIGHLYSIRDMEIDLPRGIINIPIEELEQSGLKEDDYIDYTSVKNDSDLSRWIDCEVGDYYDFLTYYKHKLKQQGDRGSRRICFPLIRGMKYFCMGYFRRKSE